MMVNAHTLPDAIQWHEGMLLAPQHFQQLSLRYESLLHYHTMVHAPFFWGIRRLEFDQVLLGNGVLRVLVLEAIMPDGLLVTLKGDEADDLQLDLNLYADDMSGRPLVVHLAVPARMDPGVIADADTPRYDSLDGAEIADEHASDGVIRIPRLRPRLRLIAGDTPPSKFVTFPLAHVSLKEGHFALTDFIPPTLSVIVREPTGIICARIARLLRDKAIYLSEETNNNQAELKPEVVAANLVKIQAIVEMLPYLEGMIYTEASHPYQLYLALCQVMGHMGSLGATRVPPTPPIYDHNNIRLTLSIIEEYINRAIDEGIHQLYSMLPFHRDPHLFHRLINPEWLARPLMIGVRGRPKVNERQVSAWVQEALIGSEPVVQSLRERRILGARRWRDEELERQIGGPGLVIFQVDQSPVFVLPGQQLQIVGEGEEDSIIEEILLVIVRER